MTLGTVKVDSGLSRRYIVVVNIITIHVYEPAQGPKPDFQVNSKAYSRLFTLS
jgi:hypothetical protein